MKPSSTERPFSLRLSPDTRRILKGLAHDSMRSLNAEIAYRLEKSIVDEKKSKRQETA